MFLALSSDILHLSKIVATWVQIEAWDVFWCMKNGKRLAVNFKQFNHKGISLAITFLVAASLSSCSSGQQTDPEACALIQEGYENLQPLLQDKYWLDNDSSARFDAARSDYGTTFQFLDEFQIVATAFDLAAGSSSLSEDDKTKLTNLSQEIRYPSDFNRDTSQASLKLIQIQTDLVAVVGICD
jgi:hypothetical protein